MTLPVRCPSCRGSLAMDAGVLACRDCERTYPNDGGVWRLTTESVGAPGYDGHYHGVIADVEDRHYWFVSRRRCLLDALRRAVPDLAQRALLDIGCGPGGLLAYLGRNGVALAGGCDAYMEGLRIARSRVEAPLFLVDDGRPAPVAPDRNLIGLFDVLEHIDDDTGTLAWLHSVLRRDGVLALTVPAHPVLWGEADVMAHHRRRYRRRELRLKLEAAGFRVERLTHFMAPLVPPLLIARLLERLFRPSAASAAARRNAELGITPVVNDVLRAVLAVERLWLKVGSLPFGSSLLAIARRV